MIVARPYLLDLAEAWTLRQSLRRHLAAHPDVDTVIFATTTAALLQPAAVLDRSALRFDALACENRLGWACVLSRLLERRALRHIRVLMPMSASRLPTLGRFRYLQRAEVVLPMPPPLDEADQIEGPDRPPHEPGRVLCYAANPVKKGLDTILRAWALRSAEHPAQLLIAGIDAAAAAPYLAEHGLPVGADVRFLGRLPQAEFRNELRRAEVYLAASRYEDFGMAQLEAVNLGAVLVSVPSGGPFEAGAILREIDPALLAADDSPPALARALDHALGMGPAARDEVVRAGRGRLAPYLRTALADRIRQRLLPAIATASS